MSVVVNNIVKMEWDKEGWLQLSPKSKKNAGAFIFASKVYPSTTHGEVTVFFNHYTAFLMISDPHTDAEDLWNAKELAQVLKTELTGGFPTDLDIYVPIIGGNDDNCRPEVLEEYGITEFASDIEARLNDLAPYGKEYYADGTEVI